MQKALKISKQMRNTLELREYLLCKIYSLILQTESF